MAAARQQVGYWKDSEAMWERCVAVTEAHHLPYTNLASAALEKKDLAAALAFADKALQLRPNFGTALSTKATALLALGRLEEAEHGPKKAQSGDCGSHIW